VLLLHAVTPSSPTCSPLLLTPTLSPLTLLHRHVLAPTTGALPSLTPQIWNIQSLKEGIMNKIYQQSGSLRKVFRSIDSDGTKEAEGEER
jgi:hypothetical protein